MKFMIKWVYFGQIFIGIGVIFGKEFIGITISNLFIGLKKIKVRRNKYVRQ